MIIVICGGRDFSDQKGLRSWLDGFHAASPITEMRCGDGANELDRIVQEWALSRDVTLNIIRADERLGAARERLRDRSMLLGADALVVFRGGERTKNTVFTALDNHLPVHFANWSADWAKGLTGSRPDD